jgi:macrodomain Ter protein organizer (MatP/YcbG family)
MEIGPITRHWKESIHHPRICHVPLFLQGRFKRQVGEKMFVQPLAYKTKSGIPIGKWMQRALRTYQELGIQAGPMFRKSTKNVRAKVADLDFLFWDVLARVQEKYPNIIAPTVVVLEEYSVMRSLRRGVTSHAQNLKIPKEIIETNNRWRKFDRARGMTPGMSMFERYSDARANLESLVAFSGAL